MKIKLSHHSNPDIPGYWTRPVDSGRVQIVPVASFEHASQVFRQYIKRNALGVGNCWCAPILDDQNGEIAHVSYNGRVWEGPHMAKEPAGKEILLRD